MKRKTKLGLGIALLSFGVLALSSCTASFCSVNDKAHILYAYDNGVTEYFSGENKPDTAQPLVVEGFTTTGIYYDYGYTTQVVKDVTYPAYKYNWGGLNAILVTATTNGFELPSVEYWAAMDSVLLKDALTKYMGSNTNVTLEDINNSLLKYGFLKFTSDPNAEEKNLWDNWSYYNNIARDIVGNIDYCPTTDFVNQYKTSMNGFISAYRSCLTTTTQNYGYYGYDSTHKMEVEIEAKDYGYGWGKGFFEGLLVWPIGALTDVLCNSMAGLGTGKVGTNTNGWAQLLTIVIVTVIVRTLMFAVSFKQTSSNAKMTELQPEIMKIQNKYPNSNTSKAEKARMADEMQKLYKKNKINPLSTIVVLIVQFPVFICVWGGLQGSAWLSTGSFFGMSFADSISSVLFNGSNWGNGSAVVALILFLLMSFTQVISMLLPQWQQKAKQKKVAKLGKNPAQNSQNNKMKWFTYIMMIMIIIMGFSLPSSMGVYWLIGAIFSIAQTLITSAITKKHSKER